MNKSEFINQQNKKPFLYGYRLDNSIFACMAKSIEEALEKRDLWIKEKLSEKI